MAALARHFTLASAESITLSVGSVTGFGVGGTTVASIIRIDDLTVDKAIMTAGTSDPNTWFVGVMADESIGLWTGTSVSFSAVSRVTTGNWYLVAVTKATGNVASRFHIYNYTTRGWVHENGAASNNGSVPLTNLWVGAGNGGGVNDNWSGELQVVAFYGSALSDASIESLIGDKAAWTNLSPAALWTLNQDKVSTALQDEIGGADQSAITGTTVTPGAPGWQDGAFVAITAPEEPPNPPTLYGPGRERSRAMGDMG